MLSSLDLGMMMLHGKRLKRGQVNTLDPDIPRHLIKVGNLGGLQIGGGINDQNAQEWIDAGASKVGL